MRCYPRASEPKRPDAIFAWRRDGFPTGGPAGRAAPWRAPAPRPEGTLAAHRPLLYACRAAREKGIAMATDPYTAPRSRVADVPAAASEGNFNSAGNAVPAGHGWDWISGGWELFKRQPGTWILLLIVFVLISFLIALIPMLGSIASNLLGPVFAGGMLLGCRELAGGGELTVGHLFAGFRENFGKLVVVGLLYLVALIVVVIVAFGITGAGIGFGALMGTDSGAPQVSTTAILLAVLVALALMVPVAMAVWFTPALVVLNDLGVGDAIKTSFSACLKNIVPFLVYGLILLGLAIVASIPFGLGWLVLGPVLVASVYASYRDIFYTR